MRKIILESETSIETPLGELHFFVNTHAGDFSRLKMKCSEIIPTLPKGMSVEKCFVVIMQCKTTSPFKDISFYCKWNNFNERGYACSGEGLEAWEWDNGEHTVTIGTEDNESLCSRIKINELNNSNYYIEMKDNVTTINLTSFPEETELSLHFIIAWNPQPEPASDSCWFAVDQPHNNLLEQCN